MKRYKVVQDDRGHWGIWDTEADDFASWGEWGAWAVSEMVRFAGHLNSDDSDRRFFRWDGEYLPRAEA